jgi:hypothetical protein
MVSVAREMAERILGSLEGDPAASGLLPPDGAPRARSRGFEARNLLFLTVIGIVCAASAGSLFTAAFVLLMEPKTAMHPAALSPVRPQTAPAAGAAKTLSLASPAASAPPPTVRYAMAQGDASDGHCAASFHDFIYRWDDPDDGRGTERQEPHHRGHRPQSRNSNASGRGPESQRSGKKRSPDWASRAELAPPRGVAATRDRCWLREGL